MEDVKVKDGTDGDVKSTEQGGRAKAEADAKKKEDTFKCPMCPGKRCPATGGSRLSNVERTRYRKCMDCSTVFKTVQKHAGKDTAERISG